MPVRPESNTNNSSSEKYLLQPIIYYPKINDNTNKKQRNLVHVLLYYSLCLLGYSIDCKTYDVDNNFVFVFFPIPFFFC